MGFNKKVLSKAVSELGKAKAPGKPKDITVDPRGYWNPANQGQPVRVPGGDDINGIDITTHQVSQPIWAQPNVGPGAIMYPEENRHFPGASYVDEYPQMQFGGPTYISDKDKPLGYDALWDTINYNPNDEWQNINNPAWKAHEDYHHKQNMEGRSSTFGLLGQRPNPYVSSNEYIGSYFDRRNLEKETEKDKMIQDNPSLQFIPRDKLSDSIFVNGQPSFLGAEERMYANPNTQEGEARLQEMQYHKLSGYKKGGTAGKLSSGNKTVTKVVNIKFDLPDLSGAKKIDDKVTLAMSPDSSGVFTIGKDVEKFSGIKESEVKADIAAGKESPEDAIIYGLTNVMNGGKDVYLWINGSRLQGMAKKNGADEAITEVVSHEAIHLARHLITRAIAKKKGLNLNNEDWIKHDYGAGEYNWPAVGDENKENPIVQIDEESFATAEGIIVEQILPYFKEMAKNYLKGADSKEFKKGGTLQSKKYSKSMSATNKLMAKNKLFQNKKSKIFDPNAEFQQGGVNTNPWLYTYDLGMPNSQVVGGGFDAQFKSGIHGGLSGEIPLFNRNSQPWLSQNVGIGRGYKGLYGDVTLNNSSSAGSLLNPSLTTSLQYNKNLGDHYNFRAGLSNVSSKGSYFNPEINAGITYSFKEGGSKLGPINLNPNPLSHYELNYGFNLPVKQDGGENEGEYMDLTDEEIQAYRDGGYVVEEIPEQEIGGYVQHEIAKAQTGLEQSDSDVYTYAGRPDSYYKKDDKGQWFISNKETGNKFIPVEDPKGTRAKILNTQAKKNVPMADSPYALAASNFANNKGTDSKQAYIDKYQNSPELAKQNTVKNYQTENKIAKLNAFINKGELEKPTNTGQPIDSRLMGPVGDNTRTAAGFNGQQAFEGALRYASPESVAARKRQADWKKQKWDEYNKMSLYDKVLDRTQAFASHPLLMTGNVLAGEQGYIPGMGRGLLNKDNPEEYDRYLQATGQQKGAIEVNDLFNMINPSYWGANAGNELHKGNYVQGVTELGLGVLGLGQGKNLLQGSKYLIDDVAKGANYAGKTLGKFNAKKLPGSSNVTSYYHGSPWRWEDDLFDASMIGKGEGATKRMKGLNLFPEEKLHVAPKFANIKSADAPIHIGSSNKIEQSLLDKLNPTVYKFDDIGNNLKLKEVSGRGLKNFKQEDLIKEGFDGIKVLGNDGVQQVTVFPSSVNKLSKASAQNIEEFVKANPNVKNWTKWTTNPKEFERITGLKLTAKELEELKEATKQLPGSPSAVNDVQKAGFDGNFLTRPLTLFTKNELLGSPENRLLYRKIGNAKGLQHLIDKGGAQAPAPMRMTSGTTIDTPFFGPGSKPNENYRGLFAVEIDPANPKYKWSNYVAGTQNKGVAPYNPETGELVKNIPLEDLNVYKKKWFSNNYKKLKPEELKTALIFAKEQALIENAYKWGVRGTVADQIFNDGNYGKAIQNYFLGKPNTSRKKIVEGDDDYENGQADITQPAFQKGGSKIDNYEILPETFNYEGRPGARYRRDNYGNWLVADKNTNGKFVAVKDKTGKRQAELNKNAISSETGKTVSDYELDKIKDPQKRMVKKAWNDYNNMSTSEKVLDRVQAGMIDPLGMISRALLGEQAYIPGMGRGVLDYENPEVRNNYLRELGYTPGQFDASDLQNIINPMYWGASAGNQFHKGNYVQGAGELGLSLLGAGQGNYLMQGAKNLTKNLGKGAKYIGNALGKESSFLSKNIGSANAGALNAGISPELIKNAVGPRNSVLARLADNAYFSPPLNQTMNRLSPLNFLPGYGSNLTGATMPLGNVINRSIKNGNLVEAPSLLRQAKNLVKPTEAKPLTAQFNNLNSDIYAAKVSGLNPGSTIGVGQPYKQGFLGRTFAKSKAQYPIQNRAGETLSEIPLSDSGVSLYRRLPFSKRYVPIDKEKLMNNQFQWSTTGAGLQNLGEKFVKSAPVYGALGAGAAALMYNPYDYMSKDAARMVKEKNIPLETLTDLPTRTDVTKQGFKDMQQSPLEFIKNPDPYGVKFYGSLLGYSQGGNVITEEWEDELDDYTINLLRKAGYVVEEID